MILLSAVTYNKADEPDVKNWAAFRGSWCLFKIYVARWLSANVGWQIIFMKKSVIIIILLIIFLVGSNAWWVYRLVDAGVSYTYQGVSLEENQQALAQSLEIIKALASSDGSREMIVAAAKKTWDSIEPFEKEGYLWVGRLGLRFNEADKLVEVVKGF